MNRDFRFLMNVLLRRPRRPLHHGSGSGEDRVQRIALPRRWWQRRCARGDIYVRPPRFFGEVREIYIVEDQSSPSKVELSEEKTTIEDDCARTQRRDGGGMTALVPEDLATCGWDVRREGRAVAVAAPESEAATYIRDFFDAPLDELDMMVGEFVRGDSFIPPVPDAGKP